MTIEKVAQNISDLIGEIGERMALFKLYELTHTQKHLEIFKNYSDSGYDIGIRNSNTGKKVKIEVKARQHLVTTTAEKSKNSCHFTLTANEKNSADFLIGYWLEHNSFFIVPTSELNPSKSKGKLLYKHIVTKYKKPKDENSIYSDASMPFCNNWIAIFNFINAKTKQP
jgi:hypothetical protein